MKKDRYEAEFSNLGLRNIPLPESFPTRYDRLLCGGIWCMVQLDYYYDEYDKDNSPISIKNLTPIQMPQIDMSELKEGSSKFTKEEWIDIML